MLDILIYLYLLGVIIFFLFGLYIIIRYNNNIIIITIYAIHLIVVSLIFGFYTYYLLYRYFMNYFTK